MYTVQDDFLFTQLKDIHTQNCDDPKSWIKLSYDNVYIIILMQLLSTHDDPNFDDFA